MIDIYEPIKGSGPVFLVACSKLKRDVPVEAKDLYLGDLFAKSRAWAEANGGEWRILSALWGVLHPTQVVGPYDTSMANHDGRAKAAWGNRCKRFLASILCWHTGPVIVLAGKDYRDVLVGNDHQRSYGWEFNVYPWLARVEVPMAGLGIGQQKAWLMAQLAQLSAVTV